MADLVDYIFQFPDFGTALLDPIVGPLLVTPPLAGFPFKELLVFPDSRVNSVVPATGYWCLITETGLTSLQTHPNIQIINDLTLMCARQPSVLFSTFDTTNINIVHDNYMLYSSGLAAVPTTPANGLIAEDGITFLVAEDGITFLVQE